MTSDRYDISIMELYEIIHQLEIRIIQLEKNLDTGVTVIAPDGWYFDY